jgi:hypothetical protein
MKKYSFFTLFAFTQLVFVFLQIHKHMQFIKQSFRKQRNERMLVEYTHNKQDLMNKLYAQQSREDIGQFAQKNGLQAAKLSQVKRVNTHV